MQTCLSLLNYVEDNWLLSTVWQVSSWSVFGQTVRTNNDCEGWHHRINGRAKKGNLQFNLLILLLYREVSVLPTQIKNGVRRETTPIPTEESKGDPRKTIQHMGAV